MEFYNQQLIFIKNLQNITLELPFIKFKAFEFPCIEEAALNLIRSGAAFRLGGILCPGRLDIFAVEDFIHFRNEPFRHFLLLLGRQRLFRVTEQIIV